MDAQPEGAEELVLVEESNSDLIASCYAEMQTVTENFRAHIDMDSDNTNYPESAAGWKLYVQVQMSGNFVCMIVLSKGYIIPETMFET